MYRLFMDRKNRDKKYKELISAGYDVRRTSHRNQLIHPMYIEDYPHKIPDNQKGFGNSLYTTHFTILYIITDR